MVDDIPLYVGRNVGKGVFRLYMVVSLPLYMESSKCPYQKQGNFPNFSSIFSNNKQDLDVVITFSNLLVLVRGELTAVLIPRGILHWLNPSGGICAKRVCLV